MLSFFIGAWLSISPIYGQSDTTSVILTEWWNNVDINVAFDISTYTITDSIKNYKIYSIMKIDSIINLDGFIERPKNTYLFALITEKLAYRTQYYCIVKDYGYSYFYNQGFRPDLLETPKVKILK